MKKILPLALISTLLAGCVFVPAKSDEEYAECPVRTQQLTLESKVLEMGPSSGGDARGFLIAVGAVTSVSMVVSGSIVLVGNTVHWLETQDKCTMRPAVQSAAKKFADGFAKMRGARRIGTPSEKPEAPPAANR